MKLPPPSATRADLVPPSILFIQGGIGHAPAAAPENPNPAGCLAGTVELELGNGTTEAPRHECKPMHVICCNVAALAVASLFYGWRAYSVAVMDQEQVLRQRVAYLLWCVAGQSC
jgi:hypothetical protein